MLKDLNHYASLIHVERKCVRNNSNYYELRSKFLTFRSTVHNIMVIFYVNWLHAYFLIKLKRKDKRYFWYASRYSLFTFTSKILSTVVPSAISDLN